MYEYHENLIDCQSREIATHNKAVKIQTEWKDMNKEWNPDDEEIVI